MSATTPTTRAKIIYGEYLRKCHNNRKVPNFEELFKGLAARGDVDIFAEVDNVVKQIHGDENREVGDSLFTAALHGHWAMIEKIMEVAGSRLISQLVYKIVKGAILGNHMSILEHVLANAELAFLIRDMPKDSAFRYCIIYERFDMLVLMISSVMKRYDIDSTVKIIGQVIYSYASVEGLKTMLDNFPQYRDILAEAVAESPIRSRSLNSSYGYTFNTYLTSTEELMQRRQHIRDMLNI